VRLLVVGGSGFIGRNVVAALGGGLTATYHQDATFPAFAAGHGAVRLRCDLLADGGPDLGGYDTCLYLAGNANHTFAAQHPDEDLRVNALAVARFVERFRGRLILLSTGAVYFGLSGPVSPRSPTAPTFPYAISKLAAELYVKSARANGRLAGATVLRFYNAFGPHEKQRRIVPRLIQRFAVEGRADFELTGPPDTTMQPMYVEDVAAALGAALRADLDGRTLDLCGPPVALIDLVRRVGRACGVEPRVTSVPTTEAPIRWRSSNRAFAGATGFRARCSLEAGVRRYRRWVEAAA
jgi:nucleoside-diphosphate-sugar epimerase